MSDIISQLTSQLGIDADQAKSGAGAIMNLIKKEAPASEFKELLGAVPDSSAWMEKAESLKAGHGAGSGAGSQFGEASGMLAGLTGGGGGVAAVIAMLTRTGMSGETAAKFLPTMLGLLKSEAGDAIFGKLLGSVPMLKAAMGGAGGSGGTGGLLGGLGKLLG